MTLGPPPVRAPSQTPLPASSHPPPMMQANAQYQSVPRNDAQRGYQSPSPQQAPNPYPRSQSSTDSYSQGHVSEYGPYSHLQHGSMGNMGSPRYGTSNESRSSTKSSTQQKYNIAAGAAYTTTFSKLAPEPDDFLHEPDGRRESGFHCCSTRGFLNVLVLFILCAGLLTLFAGYPIIIHFTTNAETTKGAFALGGTNGSGQVPIVLNSLRLVDADTPSQAMKWTNPISQESYHLVFSDEFETEGRTFWPGDDPFWTAVDLWYGATGNYEWYTPEQVNTTGGKLQITLEEKPIHDLNFRSGMLQSWNQFCYQGGYVEFSAVLPGSPREVGWWPGLWTMGNLARPGYLGTTDGMWPYSYNECDSGILLNQTARGRPGYDDIVTSRAYGKDGLSWLSGMRTPACTCSSDEHPGPNKNVGRSAPEIDVLEAQIKQQRQGEASQSLQVAPFDLGYNWDESVATVYNADVSEFNPYQGGVYQEAVSATTAIPDDGYQNSGARFVTYGMHYVPDFDGDGKGSVTWFIDGTATWTASSDSVPARQAIDIGRRLIPVEPMSLIINLGISRGFQADLDFTTLTYPAVMQVDYVRVYQNDNGPDRVSCDPPEYPTTAYIKKYEEVYNNANHTVWPNPVPKNRLTGC